MSYAGPASRRKRAPALELHQASTASGAARSARSAASKSFRPNPVDEASESAAPVFTAGLALGLLVGAGAALLLAPQAGSDTRRSIARGTRRLRRRLSNRGEDAWEDLRLELKRLQRKAARRRAASSL